MGSGRDKRKKAAKRSGKDGSGPSGDAKTSAKTDKNAAKLERRMAKAAADDDIDALLAIAGFSFALTFPAHRCDADSLGRESF